MAANTGVRTLIPALLPPGAAHVDAIYSMAGDSPLSTVLALGAFSSLVADFLVRVSPKGDIRTSTINRLPLVTTPAVQDALIERTLKLNCLTDAYAPIWEELMGTEWTPDSPLRNAQERRQALVEIDALVALDLGITADELCTLYRTQFPVLYGYDTKRDHYDANGRLVPKDVMDVWKKKKGEGLTEAELTWTHPQSGAEYLYVLPFRLLDREDDMREAYARFEAELLDG